MTHVKGLYVTPSQTCTPARDKMRNREIVLVQFSIIEMLSPLQMSTFFISNG